MDLRGVFKDVVKQVYASTQDMWFSVRYTEYDSDIDLDNQGELVPLVDFSFEAFDISYDKELAEGEPYTAGIRFIGFDYDSIPTDTPIKTGCELVVTHPTTGETETYHVRGVRVEGQDVLYIVRLSQGG